MVFKSGHVCGADPRDPWHLTQKGPQRPVLGLRQPSLTPSAQVAPVPAASSQGGQPTPSSFCSVVRACLPRQPSRGKDVVHPSHPEQQLCLPPKAPHALLIHLQGRKIQTRGF